MDVEGQMKQVTKFQPQTLCSPEFPHQSHFEMCDPVAQLSVTALKSQVPLYRVSMQPWQLSECFHLKPNTPDLRL